MRETTKQLTQLEFTEQDTIKAEKIAKSLGFEQTAYTSSSALWGLFCLKENAKSKAGCIIKTRELGFLFVSDGEDNNKGYDWGDVE